MRIVRFIHKWTGLIIGLFFLFSCLTGMTIVFGKIIGSYAPVFKWAKLAHTTLFMGRTGEKIIGVATLCAFFEILTGYVLWWSRTGALTRAFRKNNRNPLGAIKKSLGFSFPNWLSGLHCGAGFWAGIPLLIMVLTALTWSFGWYNRIVYCLFDSGAAGAWDSNLFHVIHGLHVGSWGGIGSRLLWLVSACLGATLPVTGLLLFIRRIWGKRKMP